jgi:hypothetical protein
MNEATLRDRLHDLAGTVPPSAHPRADLERRLVRRRRRVPVLVAATAAAVVAAVVVPVVLNQDDDPVRPPVATSPPASATTGEDTTYIVEPVKLGSFNEDGRLIFVWLSVERAGAGEKWCISRDVYVETPVVEQCVPMQTWPFGPNGGHLVLGQELFGENNPIKDTGPVPDLMLFVTAPQIVKLDVGRHDGAPVSVREVARTEGSAFFLADFDGPKAGMRYTAWDVNGNALESAIE